MKITHQKYPEHNLANEEERGENLSLDFILSSILGIGGVIIYFVMIDDYTEIPFKIKATAFLIYIAIRFVYYFTFEQLYGRTPGKFDTQTKVVDKNGNKPSMFQIITRNLCRFISVLSGISDDERAIHDMASNTFVVYDKTLKRVPLRQVVNIAFNISLAGLCIYYFLDESKFSTSSQAKFISLILIFFFGLLLVIRKYLAIDDNKKRKQKQLKE